MANFRMHITASSVVGIVYGTAGYLSFDVRPETCLVAGGLCALAGILPDADSDSGQTSREITGFAAAVVPLLLLDQLQTLGLSHESLVLAGGCLYLLIRFGFSGLLSRLTVHRGMWHSIPAALIAGIVASWLCDCHDLFPRFFKAVAVIAGYLTHLALDELYSFNVRRGRFRIKKSLGTAWKLWGPNLFANVTTYALLISLLVVTGKDPRLRGQDGPNPLHQLANDVVDGIFGRQTDEMETRSVHSFDPLDELDGNVER